MAKRGRKAGSGFQHPGGVVVGRPAQAEVTMAGNTAIETFAEDLGRLLGAARAKAEGWLGQRQNVAKQLEQIRDTATALLSQLAGTVSRRGRRRAKRGPGKGAMGPRATASGASPRRQLSAKARAAISRAQKKRWAKLKAAKS